MKSLKEFKCGGIGPIVDIKKGEYSQIFDEITIRASPPIWVKRTRMDIIQNSVTFFSTSEPKYTNFKTGPN